MIQIHPLPILFSNSSLICGTYIESHKYNGKFETFYEYGYGYKIIRKRMSNLSHFFYFFIKDSICGFYTIIYIYIYLKKKESRLIYSNFMGTYLHTK
jgi:hypothetical protein